MNELLHPVGCLYYWGEIFKATVAVWTFCSYRANFRSLFWCRSSEQERSWGEPRCYTGLRQVSSVCVTRDVCARGCGSAKPCYFRVWI